MIKRESNVYEIKISKQYSDNRSFLLRSINDNTNTVVHCTKTTCATQIDIVASQNYYFWNVFSSVCVVVV